MPFQPAKLTMNWANKIGLETIGAPQFPAIKVAPDSLAILRNRL